MEATFHPDAIRWIRLAAFLLLSSAAGCTRREPSHGGPATNKAKGNPAQTPGFMRHLVQRGETLRTIAGDVYGDPRRWREIYVVNRDVIRDPNLPPGGVELRIPTD